MESNENRGSARVRRFSWGVNVLLFLAVAGLLLIAERSVGLLGLWPMLFLLACGGMHFLMHRAHGHGGPGQPGSPTRHGGHDADD